MTHQYGYAREILGIQPIHELFSLMVAISPVSEERIQKGQWLNRPEAEIFRRIDTAAPLAGENTGSVNAISAELLANALGLSTSSRRQIALRAAIFQLEAGWIASAGRDRMPQKRNMSPRPKRPPEHRLLRYSVAGRKDRRADRKRRDKHLSPRRRSAERIKAGRRCSANSDLRRYFPPVTSRTFLAHL